MDNNRIAEPVTVSAGRGASWLFDGFTFFKRDWLAWVGLAIMLIILTMVSSPIPVVNILVPVISPIIIAGLMLACHQQDQGGEISVAVVFSGFSYRPGQLALRSLIEINLPTLTRTVCQTFISSEDVIRSSSRLEIHDDGVRELPSRQPLSLHQSGKSAYQALL